MNRSRFLLAAVACAISAAIASAYASAPPDQYGSFNRDNVVIRDAHTLLTWQRGVAPTEMTQAGAASFCAGLMLNGAGPWRLPTYKELLTLVDENLSDDFVNGAPVKKAIDLNAFPDTPEKPFWSSSNVAGAATGWVVEFATGSSGMYTLSTTAYVRCVQ